MSKPSAAPEPPAPSVRRYTLRQPPAAVPADGGPGNISPDGLFALREQSVPRRLPGGGVAVSSALEPVSAFDVETPGVPLVVEQIIRPTGLLDPRITVRPLKAQIDETIELCRGRIERGHRVLVTTLTKRTAEDLTDYLKDVGLKVRYLHSEIDAIERVEILRALRAGDFDVLVGINLLREGLDLPEVGLVCILDADKEGFLRSQTSLIQTAGRAARHVEGEVTLFADTLTDSIQALLRITEDRRDRQTAHNLEHGIEPTSVRRAVQKSLHSYTGEEKGREVESALVREAAAGLDAMEVLRELQQEMAQASANLEFERAALLRDQIMELKKRTGTDKISPGAGANPHKANVSYSSNKPRRGRGAGAGKKKST